MKTGLMERRQKTFASSDVNSDSGVRMKNLAKQETAKCRKKCLKSHSNKRNKCINGTRLLGELRKAGSTETDKIRKCISEFLNKAEDFSINCFCALLNTYGEVLKEDNENLYRYVGMREDVS
jgi:hypothetical protein